MVHVLIQPNIVCKASHWDKEADVYWLFVGVRMINHSAAFCLMQAVEEEFNQIFPALSDKTNETLILLPLMRRMHFSFLSFFL